MATRARNMNSTPVTTYSLLFLILLFPSSLDAQENMFFSLYVQYNKTTNPISLNLDDSGDFGPALSVQEGCASGTVPSPNLYYSVLDTGERHNLGSIQTLSISETLGVSAHIEEKTAGVVRLCIPYSVNATRIEIRSVSNDTLLLSVDMPGQGSPLPSENKENNLPATEKTSPSNKTTTLLGVVLLGLGVILLVVLIFLSRKKKDLTQ